MIRKFTLNRVEEIVFWMYINYKYLKNLDVRIYSMVNLDYEMYVKRIGLLESRSIKNQVSLVSIWNKY